MNTHRLCILGTGNLGTSLAKGLIASGQFSTDRLLLTDKRESRITQLKKMGFQCSDQNLQAVKESKYVVLSVKPQQFLTLAADISSVITENHVVLSTITGISFHEIENALGKIPAFRIMPNTALEICESMTCIAANRFSNLQLENEVIRLFDNMGKTLVIPEDMMGAATVVGACGIAFALRFMRAMSQGGIEIGFNSEMSQLITAQTIKGAASLIIETNNHPEGEIDKVTTPQGITISGLNEMEHQGLSSAVIRGLLTSFNKLENLMARSAK